jgi:hypothetical protein
MKKDIITGILLLLAFSSCQRMSGSLEEALRFAGDNRPELEKVLHHYASSLDNGLKYKAAVFLIENMPDYYSLKTEALDSFRLAVRNFGLRHEYPATDGHVRIVPSKYFEDIYQIPFVQHPQRIYDAHIITASYLIENIELAFRVWEEMPWGKSVSFESFCREILPYRIGNEPMEDWRKAYHDMYRPLFDRMQVKDDVLEAGRLVYDSIFNQRWLFDPEVISDHLGARTLWECRTGDCRLLAHYAAYAFRSVGIPSGVDCILQNPDMMYKQHYWNYLKDSDGKTIPFELYQTAPAHQPNPIKRKKGKVYRICFDKPASAFPVIHKREHLPALLGNPHLEDVSGAYFEGAEAVVHTGHTEGKTVCLGVFNNKAWIPVTCAPVRRGKAVFQHLEPGIVWQTLSYVDNRLVPVSLPFISEENGKCRFLSPDEKHTQTMQLERKYPLPGWFGLFQHRSVGGLFQGAGKEDFSDAVLLHTTTDSLSMRWQKVSIDCPQSFSYLRYCSAPDGHCNMAEIRFFSSGERIRGETIGSEGSSDHSVNKSKHAVFDDDPISYFDSPSPDGAWAGLKLQEPQRVTAIEFIFRTDDNGIREGDIYELFYFSEKGLVSLGKQTGDQKGVLYYDRSPTKALYWLHNETRGQEERVFTCENGKQIFW